MKIIKIAISIIFLLVICFSIYYAIIDNSCTNYDIQSISINNYLISNSVLLFLLGIVYTDIIPNQIIKLISLYILTIIIFILTILAIISYTTEFCDYNKNICIIIMFIFSIINIIVRMFISIRQENNEEIINNN